MAHTITRVEGFEGGHLDAHSNGNGAVLSTVQSAIKRSGTYALRVDPNGASSESTQLCFAYNADGSPDETTNFAAVSFIFYIRMVAYPDTSGRIVWELLNAALTAKSVVTMSTGGVLTWDGSPGLTAFPLGEFVEVKGIYDEVTGLITVYLNGNVEFNAIAVTTADPVNRIRFGKAAAAGTYDYIVDDVVFEAAASVASIEVPSSTRVFPILTDGDGFYDGVFITSPVTNPSFTLVQPPYDGDSSLIADSAGSDNQSYTLQDTATAAIVQTIQAVQFHAMARHNGGISNYRIFARGGDPVTDVDLVTNDQNASYEQICSCRQLSPFTSAAWTLTEIDNMEFGFRGVAIATQVRCSLMVLQVAFSPDPGTGVDQTFLDQAALVTGPLRGVTNYSPELRTVRITSEALGVPDDAFNIIACSIRHVPSGVGVIRGEWFFDQGAHVSFTLHNNPLRSGLMGTSESSFIFNESEMVDGYQVYTEYVPIEDSGKVFELTLTQEGSRGLEILGITFDIELEGKREKYLDGEF